MARTPKMKRKFPLGTFYIYKKVFDNFKVNVAYIEPGSHIMITCSNEEDGYPGFHYMVWAKR